MKLHRLGLAATLCTVLALGACSSARFGAPLRSATAAPAMPEPIIEPLPSAPIESAPLDPLPGQPLPPVAGAPVAPGFGAAPPAPSGGPAVAGLPPAQEPAPASRTAMVGNWTARDASGGTCRVQLSSSPALDLYRASASGCSNQDLSRINAWDYRDGEVYLYQTGGTVAARLRGSASSLSGVLAKSGAPLSLAR